MLSNKRGARAGFINVLVVGGLAVLLAGCGTNNSSAAIVASYNGGTVTQSQLDTQIHLDQLFNTNLSATTAVKTQVLKQYILLDRFIALKAKQAGVKVPSAQVQQAVLSIKQRATQSTYNGDPAAFAQKMQTLNLTDADIAAAVQDQMLLSAYAPTLVKSVPLSQQQQHYKANIEQYTTITERAILVKQKGLAQSLTQQLRSGGSWSQLALKYSQDPGSAKNGGVYANQNPSQWVPAFAQHAMTQPLNVVGDPFYASPYGYFVMEVLKRTIQPFSLVKSQISQQLIQSQEQTAVSTIVNQVTKTANIKVLLK